MSTQNIFFCGFGFQNPNNLFLPGLYIIFVPVYGQKQILFSNFFWLLCGQCFDEKWPAKSSKIPLFLEGRGVIKNGLHEGYILVVVGARSIQKNKIIVWLTAIIGGKISQWFSNDAHTGHILLWVQGPKKKYFLFLPNIYNIVVPVYGQKLILFSNLFSYFDGIFFLIKNGVHEGQILVVVGARSIEKNKIIVLLTAIIGGKLSQCFTNDVHTGHILLWVRVPKNKQFFFARPLHHFCTSLLTKIDFIF